MLPRLNVQTCQWWVNQMHDANDIYGVAWTGKTRPINYGARYTYTTPEVGGTGKTIPVFGQVANTQGPIGGWFCWPGIARGYAQWGQVFAAKITASGVATPMGDTTNVSDLDAIAVTTLDGSTPAIGSYGLIVAGSKLDAQYAIFFAGSAGSSGGSAFPAKIATFVGGDVYTVDLYENGFGAALTAASISATLVDTSSFQLAVGTRVSVFKANDLYYISSVKLFQTNAIALLTPGRITVNAGTGSYSWKETLYPGGADTPGGATRTVVEHNGSTLVAVNTRIFAYFSPYNGLYYFDRGLGAC